MDFIQGTLHVEGEQHRSSSRPRDGDEPHKEHLGGRILGRESPTNSGLVGDLVGFCGLTPASRQSIRCITRLSYQRTSHFGHFTYSRHIGGQRRVVPGGCTPSPGSSRSRVQQANAHASLVDAAACASTEAAVSALPGPRACRDVASSSPVVGSMTCSTSNAHPTGIPHELTPGVPAGPVHLLPSFGWFLRSVGT